MEITETKLCQKCDSVKLLSDFSNNKNSKDGKQGHCKDCYKIYYQSRREHIKKNVHDNYWLNHEETLRRIKRQKEASPERVIKARKRFKAAHPERIMLSNARNRANWYKIPLDIAENDVQIPVICPVLGIPIYRNDSGRSGNSPSLDRIVPKLGYIKTNISVISDRANRLKSDGTADEHRLISEWILKDLTASKFESEQDITKNLGMLIRAARKRSKRKNIPCSIVSKDIFVPNNCPIFGTPIIAGNKYMADSSPSLDRINPDLGYIKNNVFLVSWRANRIKSDGTADEHRRIADWMDSRINSSI